MTTSPTILIAGGGIGGLTLATALGRAGHAVEVVEIRPDWTVAGWGLSLTGPALRALDTLGLADRCIELGYGITEIKNADGGGTVFGVVALPRLLGPDRPAQVGLSRPTLARLLREAATAAGAVLRTGRSVTSVEDSPRGARVGISDGSTRDVDLVVAADGVASRTRALLGIEATPAYRGQMVWRAVVPRPAWATSLSTFSGRHSAGVIPISEESAYCFLTETNASDAAIPEGTLAAGMRDLLAPFGGPLAAVRENVRNDADVVRRPIRTVLVEEPWYRGHAALLGDAAHTPSPQLVSGATLAIEDAVVLTEELGRQAIAEALAAYDERRRDRARLVVDASIEAAALDVDGRQRESAAVIGRTHAALAAAV